MGELDAAALQCVARLTAEVAQAHKEEAEALKSAARWEVLAQDRADEIRALKEQIAEALRVAAGGCP